MTRGLRFPAVPRSSLPEMRLGTERVCHRDGGQHTSHPALCFSPSNWVHVLTLKKLAKTVLSLTLFWKLL